jgi:hypothetical protein
MLREPLVFFDIKSRETGGEHGLLRLDTTKPMFSDRQADRNYDVIAEGSAGAVPQARRDESKLSRCNAESDYRKYGKDFTSDNYGLDKHFELGLLIQQCLAPVVLSNPGFSRRSCQRPGTHSN